MCTPGLRERYATDQAHQATANRLKSPTASCILRSE
eukprot:CAMPEP_0119333236 /NCGR_PEP_ID=MMETSP1333-20130426/84666_1 /TAXON_ID=418940 /ORGANISM="Scyphosphaera apsteinii, Strain RCC1455" /LENGTH=35 /DNA_ID= /DNA_START= /DNA_END= /DNA_ORIENTATION=